MTETLDGFLEGLLWRKVARIFWQTDGLQRSTFVLTTAHGVTLHIEVVDDVVVKAEVTT